MPSQQQHPTCVFRIILLAGLTVALMLSVVLPMSAQSPVPATANEAARMPQFASRLHPASGPVSRSKPATARIPVLKSAPEGPIYNNGPINGTVDAWQFSFPYTVSESFTVTRTTSLTEGMTLGAWLLPGDTLFAAQLTVTSQPNGGTIYYDLQPGFEQTGCALNQAGFNVCTETIVTSVQGPDLQPGTYWVNLQNADASNQDPVFWDQNSGVGCSSPGCPSQAYSNRAVTIPSEAFTMFGENPPPPACFGSQGNLQIIYNFTQQQAGNSVLGDVTIDRAGNLYGTGNNGGDNGAGFAFKLARFSGWLFDPLFSFSGGNNGSQPAGVIVGPNGSLFGGAQGGIQNCGSGGSQTCGLVFNLKPKPTACPATHCDWIETVPYRFSSDSDGSGLISVSASDQAGNLYGITTTGGNYGHGTVFELTPSGAGWTKSTLYSFTGGNDGDNPTAVLTGNDGNLYGTTAAGGIGDSGVVFQLTPSDGGWIQSVLHQFLYSDGQSPSFLAQDGAGNLYGTTTSPGPYALIFVLEKTSSGWVFNEDMISHGGPSYDNLTNLVTDAAGNVYGTGSGGFMIRANRGDPSINSELDYYSYIFKAWYASDGWHYEDLDFLGYQYFPTGGSLALDSSGTLYGTTSGCGTNNAGTVWQFAP